MRVATWNVNSVRARLDRLLAWLTEHQPALLCLQELKVSDDAFPHLELRALGYYAAVHGQKSYNGVGIVSRVPLTAIEPGLSDGVDDAQARLLRGRCGRLTVLSAYVPNGSRVDSDAFSYKLRWLERLAAYLKRCCDPTEPLLLCGDLNIAPADVDVARPEQWKDSVLCVPEVRKRLALLQDWGLTDTLRLHEPDARLYSWWDYRMLGFQKNNGLRIDHILATAPAAERCSAVWIDRQQRKGRGASDHAPVVAEFDATGW